MTPPLTEKELKKQYETYREMNLSSTSPEANRLQINSNFLILSMAF
ncbi:MAG: hypothetical protein CM1200mP24_01130 [Gammaproteobacteria bacterium]|nr:MAG: hypothetical protein CM1200mP24_01130 [Gammaproteobacteria bacterium]